GVAAGEVASRLAIESMVNLVLDVPDWILLPDDEGLAAEVMRRAEERYRQVHAVLAERGSEEPGLRGMGTTMTLAWSLGRELFTAHVGDSRAYLFRGGTLWRLTRDHTVAQALADHGMIAPDEVAKNRMRHVLTRSLGGGAKDVQAEVQHLRLADGDCLLLCT